MTTPLSPDSPIDPLAGWTKRSIGPLNEIGIETVADLLHHYPRSYIDRSRVAKIGDIRINQVATFIGIVKKVDTIKTRNQRPIVTVQVFDGTGHV
ncbi:MAG: hypothetical protein ACRDJP_11560, partial [Actinomycetota bacterium]